MAVGGAVVPGERRRDHAPRHDLTVDDPGALDDGAEPDQRKLRRIAVAAVAGNG